ncbi:hypothetical protein L484_011936 [Morus notabilis]|uniref:Uncharacterized protein n=1 Tax=Morus notabilis TaxID=981085 RepID=W9QID1_9ROSA|nr:hypothetical protein L484_011936 [Morus notabilis]
MHDYATGRNVTDTYIHNKPADILKFGSAIVVDDKLTEAYNWDSPQIEVQGGFCGVWDRQVSVGQGFCRFRNCVPGHP